MQTAFPQSGMNNDSFHSLSEIAKSLISGLICKDYLLKIKSRYFAYSRVPNNQEGGGLE